ncbi:MAG: hypothetical protein ACTSPI_00755 [Candidatus Heimdallarchaeaceae archaeon]
MKITDSYFSRDNLQSDFLKKVEDIKNRAESILVERGKGYNNDFSIPEYFIHGIQDCIFEIYKKVMRAESLSKVQNYRETLDSFIDIINYAAFAGALVLMIEEQHKGEGKEEQCSLL